MLRPRAALPFLPLLLVAVDGANGRSQAGKCRATPLGHLGSKAAHSSCRSSLSQSNASTAGTGCIKYLVDTLVDPTAGLGAFLAGEGATQAELKRHSISKWEAEVDLKAGPVVKLRGMSRNKIEYKEGGMASVEVRAYASVMWGLSDAVKAGVEMEIRAASKFPMEWIPEAMRNNHQYILAVGSYAAQGMLARSAWSAVKHILFKVWEVVKEAVGKGANRIQAGVKNWLNMFMPNPYDSRGRGDWQEAPTADEKRDVLEEFGTVAAHWESVSDACYRDHGQNFTAFKTCYLGEVVVERTLLKFFPLFQKDFDISGDIAECVGKVVDNGVVNMGQQTMSATDFFLEKKANFRVRILAKRVLCTFLVECDRLEAQLGQEQDPVCKQRLFELIYPDEKESPTFWSLLDVFQSLLFVPPESAEVANAGGGGKKLAAKVGRYLWSWVTMLKQDDDMASRGMGDIGHVKILEQEEQQNLLKSLIGKIAAHWIDNSHKKCYKHRTVGGEPVEPVLAFKTCYFEDITAEPPFNRIGARYFDKLEITRQVRECIGPINSPRTTEVHDAMALRRASTPATDKANTEKVLVRILGKRLLCTFLVGCVEEGQGPDSEDHQDGCERQLFQLIYPDEKGHPTFDSILRPPKLPDYENSMRIMAEDLIKGGASWGDNAPDGVRNCAAPGGRKDACDKASFEIKAWLVGSLGVKVSNFKVKASVGPMLKYKMSGKKEPQLFPGWILIGKVKAKFGDTGFKCTVKRYSVEGKVAYNVETVVDFPLVQHESTPEGDAACMSSLSELLNSFTEGFKLIVGKNTLAAVSTHLEGLMGTVRDSFIGQAFADIGKAIPDIPNINDIINAKDFGYKHAAGPFLWMDNNIEDGVLKELTFYAGMKATTELALGAKFTHQLYDGPGVNGFAIIKWVKAKTEALKQQS